MIKFNFTIILLLVFENFAFTQTIDNNLDFEVSNNNALDFSRIQNRDFFIQEKSILEYTNTVNNIDEKNCNTDLKIFTNQNPKITRSNVTRNDSLPMLKLTRIDGEKTKTRFILEDKKILIMTLDSVKFKGKLKIINKDSIQIKSIVIPINNILIIKKPVNAARITGNIIGGLFSYIGVAILIDFGVSEGGPYFLLASALSSPFYAMNYVRRKYELNSKWKAEIEYFKNRKKKN
jgi:Asp-tRNA(Asn)/Glu-tRNA(Gln) amidotransferase C subunit